MVLAKLCDQARPSGIVWGDLNTQVQTRKEAYQQLFFNTSRRQDLLRAVQGNADNAMHLVDGKSHAEVVYYVRGSNLRETQDPLYTEGSDKAFDPEVIRPEI